MADKNKNKDKKSTVLEQQHLIEEGHKTSTEEGHKTQWKENKSLRWIIPLATLFIIPLYVINGPFKLLNLIPGISAVTNQLATGINGAIYGIEKGRKKLGITSYRLDEEVDKKDVVLGFLKYTLTGGLLIMPLGCIKHVLKGTLYEAVVARIFHPSWVFHDRPREDAYKEAVNGNVAGEQWHQGILWAAEFPSGRELSVIKGRPKPKMLTNPKLSVSEGGDKPKMLIMLGSNALSFDLPQEIKSAMKQFQAAQPPG